MGGMISRLFWLGLFEIFWHTGGWGFRVMIRKTQRHSGRGDDLFISVYHRSGLQTARKSLRPFDYGCIPCLQSCKLGLTLMV